MQRISFTTAGFARVVERAAAVASLDLKAHPHMLCHACGYGGCLFTANERGSI